MGLVQQAPLPGAGFGRQRHDHRKAQRIQTLPQFFDKRRVGRRQMALQILKIHVQSAVALGQHIGFHGVDQRRLSRLIFQQRAAQPAVKGALLRQCGQMHPRLHPVFRRQRQQRFVIGDHQRALRRDAVCKGRQVRHIGQHRSQLLLPDERIGVAVDPQRSLLFSLQRHDQLLVRQYVGLPAQKIVVLVQRQHRHALLPGDALQRFTGLHHMDPLRFINDQCLAHCQRAVGRRCV